MEIDQKEDVEKEKKREKKETLSDTLQDYLEAMYAIILEKSGVRVKDIAKSLKVKNSSVVSALRALTESGYINYEPYGIISLTQKGSDMARLTTEKHRILRHFFQRIIGLPKEQADETACKMEHAMTTEVFTRFVQFIKYIYVTYKHDPGWLEGFKEFYQKEPLDVLEEDGIDEFFNDVGGLKRRIRAVQ